MAGILRLRFGVMAQDVFSKAAISDVRGDVRDARICRQSAGWPLRLAAVVSVAALAGCAYLPASAPTSVELVSNADNSSLPYEVVKVDRHVATVLAKRIASFGATFQKTRYTPTNKLRAGDAIAITIYEAGGSSLFPPPPSNSAMAPSPSTFGALGAMPTSFTAAPSGPTSAVNTIPPQIIEADGTIEMPFVGRMKVAGLSPAQVGTSVEQALKGKAVAPQVIVTLAANTTNTATVGGEVNAAKLVPLSLRGERLLDVIAAAGGPKYPAYESYVEVARNHHVGKLLLQAVVSNPVENIIIQPNDQIFLTRNPRTYVVMGATQRPAVYPFDRERISLAEGIAQAGGPVDLYGDPGGIYLFRYEPWHLARDVMNPDEAGTFGGIPPKFVPILYRLDLRGAEGYFLAQAIQLRDKDVILVTNAGGAQLTKMLALIRGFTGIAYDLKKQYVVP